VTEKKKQDDKPESRQELGGKYFIIKRLREFLASKERYHTFVDPKEFYEPFNKSSKWYHFNIGDQTYFQTWLEINDGAPAEVKEFMYKYMERIAKNFGKKGDPLTLLKKSKEDGKDKITKIEIDSKPKLKKLSEVVGSTNYSLVEKQMYSDTHQLTKVDATIEQIRKKFVYAPVGDFPSVHKIMKDMNLLSSSLDALTDVTEEMVRSKMMLEEWKQQRAEYITNTWDMVQEENKIVEESNLIEARRVVFRNLRYADRINSQIMNNGVAYSLQKDALGNSIPIKDGRLDLAVVGVLAESLRRLGNTGPNVAIQINNVNNNNKNQPVDNVSRLYLNTLKSMSDEQLKLEVEKLNQLSALIKKEDPVTIDMEIIDD